MTLTRRQKATVVALVIVLIVPQLYLLTVQIKTLKSPTLGPNPDGSWGSYAEPMVQVKGIRIKYGEEDEAMLILEINIGQGRKYGATITIPVYPLTKEAGLEVDQ